MKKIKKIITILIILMLVIFIKSTTYATDDWLTNLTGQGQESISVWSSNLGTCSIYVYGTKNGGKVELVEGSSKSFR